MTHIEVVREGHESFDKVRKTIAQLSEYLADEGYGPRHGDTDPLENGYNALRILDSLEAELAQAKQDITDAAQVVAEYIEDLAQVRAEAKSAWEKMDEAINERAQAREERDRMIEVTAEHPERAYTWYAEMRRYREALERIAAAKGWASPAELRAIARAALTDEPEPGGWDKRIPPEAFRQPTEEDER